jgi:hypothetical protein
MKLKKEMSVEGASESGQKDFPYIPSLAVPLFRGREFGCVVDWTSQLLVAKRARLRNAHFHFDWRTFQLFGLWSHSILKCGERCLASPSNGLMEKDHEFTSAHRARFMTRMYSSSCRQKIPFDDFTSAWNGPDTIL